MADQLTTSSGSGTTDTSTPATTQTLQSTGGTTGGTPLSSVQPEPANAVQSSQGGLPLNNETLSTARLIPIATSTTGTVQPVQLAAPKHHLNTPLLGVAIVFVVIAGVLFWTAGHSVKSTT